jgi:hypothetical protein
MTSDDIRTLLLMGITFIVCIVATIRSLRKGINKKYLSLGVLAWICGAGHNLGIMIGFPMAIIIIAPIALVWYGYIFKYKT